MKTSGAGTGRVAWSGGARVGRTVAVPVEPGGGLPPRWSASALSGYRDCGLRFWFTKVSGWREPTTVPLAVGNVAHGVLQDVFEFPAGQRAGVDLEPLFTARLDEYVPAGAPVDRDEVETGARAAVATYFTLEPDPDSVAVVPGGVERELDATVAGVGFLGYVDRMSDGPFRRVTDYKTGKSDPAWLASKFRQQYLYTAALHALGDPPVEEIELLFLGPNPRSVVRPVYPAAVARAVHDLEQAVESAAADLAAGRWTARTSGLCRMCPFARMCPALVPSAPQPGSPASDTALTAAGLARRSSGLGGEAAAADVVTLVEEIAATETDPGDES